MQQEERAERAGTSTGSVYHHFRDKEAIFRTLLDRFRAAVARPAFPLTRVYEEGAFPDDLPRTRLPSIASPVV